MLSALLMFINVARFHTVSVPYAYASSSACLFVATLLLDRKTCVVSILHTHSVTSDFSEGHKEINIYWPAAVRNINVQQGFGIVKPC